MSEHKHDTDFVQDEGFWNERYRSSPHVWSGNPNPQLVAEIANLEPGRALDVGCGEGADAIWLARRGWAVVATDISNVALERAAQHGRDSDAAASTRIEWRQADLLVRPPEPDSFDLVSAQFMHLTMEARTRLFTALARSVRAGGTLLVVGHHPSDLATGVRRPRCRTFSTPRTRSPGCLTTRGRSSSTRPARGRQPHPMASRSPSTTPFCWPPDEQRPVRRPDA
jgi:SAM-dependent methyltransferase